MKFFKILKNIKSKIIAVEIIIVLTFFFVDWSIVSGCNGIKLSLFDLIINCAGSGCLSKMIIGFPIVICFVFLVISIISSNDNVFVILRYKSKQSMWRKQSIDVIAFSFIYSFIVVIQAYLISGIVNKSFQNNWTMSNSSVYLCLGKKVFGKVQENFSTIRILFLLFICLFVGLVTIGMIVAMLKLFFKVEFVYLFFIGGIFVELIVEEAKIIITYMALNYKHIVYTKEFIINMIFLGCLGGLAYIIGKGKIVNKDYLQGKIE